MGRAVRAAEAKDWATAIAAAEEARPHISDVKERAGLDAFIFRCRQAQAWRSSAGPAATPSKGSGRVTAIWVIVLVLTLLSFTSLAADNRSFVVDGNTVRIRGPRGAVLSGQIPTGASLDRQIAYPAGLTLAMVDTANGKRSEQTVLPPSRPNWPDTIRTRAGSGNQNTSATVSVTVPNVDGNDPRRLRGEIAGRTRFPRAGRPWEVRGARQQHHHAGRDRGPRPGAGSHIPAG
jgi:hypothetical protein